MEGTEINSAEAKSLQQSGNEWRDECSKQGAWFGEWLYGSMLRWTVRCLKQKEASRWARVLKLTDQMQCNHICILVFLVTLCVCVCVLVLLMYWKLSPVFCFPVNVCSGHQTYKDLNKLSVLQHKQSVCLTWFLTNLISCRVPLQLVKMWCVHLCERCCVVKP